MKQLNLFIILLALVLGACSNAPQEGTKIGNPTINVPDTQQAAEMQKFLTENSQWEAIVSGGCGDDTYRATFDTKAGTVTVKTIENTKSETINYTINEDGSVIAESESYIVRGLNKGGNTFALEIEIKGCGTVTPLTLIYQITSASIYISAPPSEQAIKESSDEDGDGTDTEKDSDSNQEIGPNAHDPYDIDTGVMTIPAPTTREIVMDGRFLEHMAPSEAIPVHGARGMEILERTVPTAEEIVVPSPEEQ